MKKAGYILLVLMLLLSLAACGSTTQEETPHKPQQQTAPEQTETELDESIPEQSNPSLMRPDKDQLWHDLDRLLQEKRTESGYCLLTLRDLEIKEYAVEDNVYSAEIDLVAESTFAEYEYTANVVYTQAPHGWNLAECDWADYGSDLIRYPDEDDLLHLDHGSDILSLDALTLNEEITSIVATGIYTYDWSPYVTARSECKMTWYYDDRQDCWNYSSTYFGDTEYELASAFEDLWYNTLGGTISDGNFIVMNTTVEPNPSSCYATDEKISFRLESSDDLEVCYFVQVTIHSEPQFINGINCDVLIQLTENKGNVYEIRNFYHNSYS